MKNIQIKKQFIEVFSKVILLFMLGLSLTISMNVTIFSIIDCFIQATIYIILFQHYHFMFIFISILIFISI
jgi:hypothetical protein